MLGAVSLQTFACCVRLFYSHSQNPIFIWLNLSFRSWIKSDEAQCINRNVMIQQADVNNHHITAVVKKQMVPADLQHMLNGNKSFCDSLQKLLALNAKLNYKVWASLFKTHMHRTSLGSYVLHRNPFKMQHFILLPSQNKGEMKFVFNIQLLILYSRPIEFMYQGRAFVDTAQRYFHLAPTSILMFFFICTEMLQGNLETKSFTLLNNQSTIRYCEPHDRRHMLAYWHNLCQSTWKLLTV